MTPLWSFPRSRVSSQEETHVVRGWGKALKSKAEATGRWLCLQFRKQNTTSQRPRQRGGWEGNPGQPKREGEDTLTGQCW